MVKKLLRCVLTLLLCLLALAMLSPILLVAWLSVKDVGFSAYIDFYLWEPSYLRALVQSLLMSLSSSVGTVLVALLAAYVFAKVPFLAKNVLFYLYIIVMIMPFQVTLLPQYIMAKNLHLYDTLFALILPNIFAPFAVFLLTQCMKSVPNDVIEAAKLETSSTLTILTRIVFPTLKPGILCAWVLAFSEQWNAVAEPLILLESREKYPLSLLLHEITWENTADHALAFAGCVIYCFFVLALFLLFEEEVIHGLEKYKLK